MCESLDANKKKKGCNAGNLYFCKKRKMFINVYATEPCDKYEKDWSRKRSDSEKIEEDSKKYDDRKLVMGEAVFALVGIILFGIIATIFS